jgi:virginiamycin B lyase
MAGRLQRCAMSATLSLAAIVLPIGTPSAHADGIHIVEHDTPSKRGPIDIKYGPDGNLYFSYFGNRMGQFNLKTKEMTDIEIPREAGTPYAVNGGPGNYMWITTLYGYGYGNDIGRVNLATHQVEYWEIPTPYSYAADLKTGPDGALWFTETRSDKIGRFDPDTHKFDEWSVGINGANPQDIAIVGGLIWWADQGHNGNALQSIDPYSHEIKTYKFPTENAAVLDIDPGSNGHSIWFGEMGQNKVGVFDTESHQYREFDVPTADSVPLCFAAGPDNAMYFTEMKGSKLGRVDLDTFAITELPTLTPNAVPLDITAEAPPGAAHGGNMYFSEGGANKIAEVVIPQNH